MSSKKKSDLLKAKRERLIFYWICLAFPLLQFAVFWIGVNAKSLLFCFQEYDLDSLRYVFNHFENFEKVFYSFTNDGTYLQMLYRSIYALISTLCIGIPFGLLFSFYFSKKMKMSGFFHVMLYLPQMISTVVLTLLFRYFADRFLPEAIGFIMPQNFVGFISDDRYQFATLIFYSLLTGFGTTTILYASAMSAVPKSLSEAAQLDGCNEFKEFIYITFPSIYSTFSVFVITTLATLFTNQLHEYTFFTNGSALFTYNQTLGYALYRDTVLNNTPQGYPLLATYGILYSVVTIAITFFARWLLGRIGPSVD